MNEKVWCLGENNHERLRKWVAQPAPNHRAWILVEQTIPSRGLVDSQVHATSGFENAQILSEGGMGILGMMNHSVGNDDVGNRVGERKTQVVRNSSGAAIPLSGKFQRNPAAVDPDAAKPAIGEKSEDSSRATADVEDESV